MNTNKNAAIAIRTVGAQNSLRLQMLRRGLLAGLPVVIIFSGLDLTAGFRPLGWAEAITAITMLMLYSWAIKYPRRANIIANLLVLCASLICLTALITGGLAGIGFVWSIGLPFVVCFLLGARAAAFWIVVYGLLMAASMFLHLPADAISFSYTEAMYICVSYSLFGSLSFFMTQARDSSEGMLLAAKSDLRREAQALKASEAHANILLNTIPGGVGVHRDGKWIYMNPAGLNILRAADSTTILGQSILDYVHADFHAQIRARMHDILVEKKPAPMIEMQWIRADGEHFPAEIQGAYIEMDGELAIMTAFRDISLRKHAEAEREIMRRQMEHAQRLESLGILSGGIAHDFNNVLAGIIGNAELAQLDAEKPEHQRAYLDTISTISMRASELCKQLLAYAGKGRYDADILDINSMLSDMEDMLQSSTGRHIGIRSKFDNMLPAVLADNAQLQQVVLNFMVNAAQAIGQQTGEISITTQSVQLDRQQLDTIYRASHLPAGHYASIRVCDNGCGMTAATQARIFDPFFTSKETGSGLGLSAVLGIVKAHQGAIRVQSQPGEGSMFEVVLPASSCVPKMVFSDIAGLDAWQGAGTILVVDDDEVVRKTTCSSVEHFGFDVLFAVNGIDGVEKLERHSDRITAVLLDMTMPKMGGLEAMRKMRHIKPGLPIIIVSGYSDTTISALPDKEKPAEFIHKPFQLQTLKLALYKVLQLQKKQQKAVPQMEL